MVIASRRKKTGFKYLWITRYFFRQWKLLCALALFLLLTISFQLGAPLLLRNFLDSASGQSPLTTIFLFAILYIVAAFSLRGVRVGESYLAELVAWKATNALRIDLVRHCLSLDLPFHQEHTPGELIERIDGDVSILNNFFSRFVLVLITNTLMLLGVLVILTIIDWRVGLLFFLYACLYLATLTWLNAGTAANFVNARQAEADLFGFLEERLGGMEDIGTSGAAGYVLRRLTALMRQRLHKQRHAQVVQSQIGLLRRLLYVVGILTGLAFAAILYRQGQITIGTAYMIFQYISNVWDPMRDLIEQLNDFQQALASLQRLSDLFSATSVIVDGARAELPKQQLAVRFEGVTFAYKGTEAALHEVSFCLKAGRTLGILGRTGSGKSTLTRLLFRFYDPQQGQIYLNDIDIKEVNVQALRSRIGLVTQDIQLFYTSLRDNVTFFDRSLSDEALLEAFEMLGLNEWYRQLPDGLETRLRADSLSAGQAQLIALTRAFLQKPDLVILDEASSRLDPLTESLLQHAMSKLVEGRTAIIIAHRLKTVSTVDDILVLQDGRVGEYGPREEVASQSTSLYTRLLATDRRQMLLEADAAETPGL